MPQPLSVGEALSTLRGAHHRLNEPTNSSDQKTPAPVGELMAFDQEWTVGGHRNLLLAKMKQLFYFLSRTEFVIS
jgi:hypothetical protein